MRPKLPLFLALLLAAPAPGHDPYERPLVPVSAGDATTVSVSSDNDLTAAAWVDPADHHVYVSLSDGRARSFGAPIQADKDASGAAKTIREQSCKVLYDDQSGGNKTWVYVIWEDTRNDDPNTGLVETDLYLSGSSNGGASWTEVVVDKNHAPGTGTVVEWRFDSFKEVLGNHLWVLLTVDPDGSSNDELYLVTSHDAGASFEAPEEVSREAAGTWNISAIDLALDGDEDTHVIFVDDRNGQHTAWYQHSPDGGASWLPADQDLGAVSDVDATPGQTGIKQSGLDLAAVWQEDLGGGRHALYLNASKDLGLSWSGALQIGGYTPGTDDTDNPSLGLDFTTSPPVIYVAWEDDRNGAGMNDVFVGGSYDLGKTFVEERELSASLGGRAPMLIERRRVEDEMQCAFLRGAPGAEQAYIGERVYNANFWHPAYNLSWSHAGAVPTSFDAVWDPTYKNAIVCLVDASSGSSQVHAGGMRMPFVEPEGFLGGGLNIVWFSGDRLTQAHAAGSTTAVFGVFLSSSNAPGLPMGDGRTIDLKADALLNLSLKFHNLVFSAPLGTGTGISTPLFKWKVPAGFDFFVAGLVYDFDAGGNLILREVTDTVEVIVP